MRTYTGTSHIERQSSERDRLYIGIENVLHSRVHILEDERLLRRQLPGGRQPRRDGDKVRPVNDRPQGHDIAGLQRGIQTDTGSDQDRAALLQLEVRYDRKGDAAHVTALSVADAQGNEPVDARIPGRPLVLGIGWVDRHKVVHADDDIANEPSRRMIAQLSTRKQVVRSEPRARTSCW